MNSANLEQWKWRDPAEVAERVEAGTCQGCGWVLKTSCQWKIVESCSKGRPFGRRCKEYLETSNGK